MPPEWISLATPSVLEVEEIADLPGDPGESSVLDRLLETMRSLMRTAMHADVRIRKVLHALFSGQTPFGIDSVVTWGRLTYGEDSNEVRGLTQIATRYERRLDLDDARWYRTGELCADGVPWCDVTTGRVRGVDGDHALVEVWLDGSVERETMWVPLRAFPNDGSGAREGKYFKLRRRSDGTIVRLGAEWILRPQVDLEPVLRSIEDRISKRASTEEVEDS